MPQHHSRIALAVLIVSLVVAACGEDGTASGAGAGSRQAATTMATPTTTRAPLPPSDYAGFAAQPAACGAATPAPLQQMTFAAPEDQGIEPGHPIAATITTSCGDIVVELYTDIAPATVNSFVFLARSGYFDGSVSHRVMPGFIVQAGDPTATGMGGPGYVLPDELPDAGFVYAAGSLAMANSGPDSGGSQFFITLADAALPNAYTYFGKVIDGLDTLDAISGIPLGTSPFGELSVPLETLYIDRIVIEE